MGASEIKFLSNPYSWMGFALAWVAAVWAFRMNALTSNLSLVCAVVLLIIGISLHHWIRIQPGILRLLWVVSASSSTSLALYYTLWIPKSPLVVIATTTTAERDTGAVVGGIYWLANFTEIRLRLDNPSRFDYRDLDLIIIPDKPIVKVGHIRGIAPSISLHDEPSVTPEWLDQSTGKRKAMSLEVVASELGYRLRCDVLPRKSHSEVIMVAVNVVDKPTGIEADRLLCVRLTSGRAIWFGDKAHSVAVFGEKPIVKSLSLSGQYSARNREQRVSSTLKVIDLNLESVQNVKHILAPDLRLHD